MKAMELDHLSVEKDLLQQVSSLKDQLRDRNIELRELRESKKVPPKDAQMNKK
jgi:hypothetical protein